MRKTREKKCVNAHDRCYGGAGAPCPYCEFVVKEYDYEKEMEMGELYGPDPWGLDK